MFFKIGVLRISQYSQETPVLKSLPETLVKKTPTQAFSCEYCKKLRAGFFIRTPPGLFFLLLFNSGLFQKILH